MEQIAANIARTAITPLVSILSRPVDIARLRPKRGVDSGQSWVAQVGRGCLRYGVLSRRVRGVCVNSRYVLWHCCFFFSLDYSHHTKGPDVMAPSAVRHLLPCAVLPVQLPDRCRRSAMMERERGFEGHSNSEFQMIARTDCRAVACRALGYSRQGFSAIHSRAC